MENKITEAKAFRRERQKKFLLFLPVVVIPFMTLLLWSVGVVGSEGKVTSQSKLETGFNFQLPAARQAGDSNWNKMQYYAKADKDSERMRSLIRANDPAINGGSSGFDFGGGKADHISGVTLNTDPREQMIEEKIAALRKRLSPSSPLRPESTSYANELPEPPPAEKAAALERMREIDQWAGRNKPAGDEAQPDLDAAAPDPELEKLDGMLSKVLDIQHPERVRQSIQEQSEAHTRLVYPVVEKKGKVAVTELSIDPDTAKSPPSVKEKLIRFYGLEEDAADTSTINTIAAEIPETQVLVNGAMVKLRLLADVYIHGVLIPRGQLLYGVASLKGERLEIGIHSIGYQGRLLPVDLTVYDMDDQEGLFIPGAITREVARQSADQGIETLNFGTYDASLGAQAASAGIQAAKQLIGRKIKLVKVTVRSGYQVLLKDLNVKEKG